MKILVMERERNLTLLIRAAILRYRQQQGRSEKSSSQTAATNIVRGQFCRRCQVEDPVETSNVTSADGFSPAERFQVIEAVQNWPSNSLATAGIAGKAFLECSLKRITCLEKMCQTVSGS